MKVTVIPIVIGAFSTVTKGLIKVNREFGNKRANRDHPNVSVIKICLITKKNPGYLMRLAVTQTPVENNHLTLV